VGVVTSIRGHKSSATAKTHCRHRLLDLLRAWLVKIEGRLLKQAYIEQPVESEATTLSAV